MKPQIFLSIGIALILVGSAGWVRFVRTEASLGTLIYVQEKPSDLKKSELDELKSMYLSANTDPNPSGNDGKNLTQTDLISRQLFSDYVDLSTRGQATAERLDSLAGAYASSIADLALVDVPNVTTAITVPDSVTSLTTYWQQVSSIRAKYQILVSQSISRTKASNASVESFAEFAKLAEGFFSSVANEFQAVPVPESLKNIHLALINNYLLSAQNMSVIANISEDQILAYSALISQAEASREEMSLFSSIQNALFASGVTVTTDDI